MLPFDGGEAKHSPHCGAVEVDHQPLAGVEGDGVGELDAFHPLSKLGTHEGGASVGSVHVKPELFLLRIDDRNMTAATIELTQTT